MKRQATISSTAIVWVDGRRLRSFYRGGKLLPFLVQPPHLTAMIAARSVVKGEVFLAGNLATGLSSSTTLDALPAWKRQSAGGLWAALKGIQQRRLKGDRFILIDASACFVSPATLRALLQRLAEAEVAATADQGAAIAITRRALIWLRRNPAVRAVADLTGLYRLVAAASAGPTLAEPVTAGVGEAPLQDTGAIYAAAREHKTAAGLRLVEAGLGLRDPGQIELRGKLTFGRNVFIDVNATIIGDVILEDGVTIGPNCILEDVRIKTRSTIKEFSLLSGAQVGEGCRIGPFARIRPGSILGAGCQIGNFVEIKNATLGRNCKINHHNFIGDALIGDDVIIGAGSITCNFDGTKSNVTRIRSKAFIGSGVMMVAPVTVGRNAFVGAGSTLVSDAPAHGLTLARARQVSIRGWAKKQP